MAKKNSKKPQIISTILSFLLAIFITMFSYLIGLNFGLFNINNLVDSMNVDFYIHMNEYIRKEAVNIAIPYGVDRSVFDNVFTMDITSIQASNRLRAQLKNESYEVNTSDVKQRLYANIDQFLSSKGYTLTAEQQNNIDSLVEKVCEIYIDALTIPYMKQFARIGNTFNKYILYGMIIIFIMIVLNIVFLFLLNKYIHKCFRYISYATISASIMTAFLPIWALIDGFYRRIYISIEYVYTFFVNYIRNSIMIFVYISALLLAISAALIVLIWYRRKALIAHNKEEAHRRHQRHIQRRMQEEREFNELINMQKQMDSFNKDTRKEFINYYEYDDSEDS